MIRSPISTSSRRPSRRRRSAPILAALIAAAVGILVPASAAQAAYYYASNRNVAEYQSSYSGLRPTLSGGHAEVELFAPEGAYPTVYIESYYAAPGYQTISHTYGIGSHTQNFAGSRSNAHQRCYWVWPYPGNVTDLDITCYAF